jgi:hypothetical protein
VPAEAGPTGGVKAYARHRKAAGLTGGSPAAVRKADARGDVVWFAPGVIDFAATDARWTSDAIQEAWRDEGEPQGGTPVPPAATPAPTRRAAAAAPPRPAVVPRQQDASAHRLKESRANREEVVSLLKLRELQHLEGELMRAAEATALTVEVVGRICDRMDALADAVTEDLVAMVTEWVERARAGEEVTVDTGAIHALIAAEVRDARDGAAETIAGMRDGILQESAPE